MTYTEMKILEYVKEKGASTLPDVKAALLKSNISISMYSLTLMLTRLTEQQKLQVSVVDEIARWNVKQ